MELWSLRGRNIEAGFEGWDIELSEDTSQIAFIEWNIVKTRWCYLNYDKRWTGISKWPASEGSVTEIIRDANITIIGLKAFARKAREPAF